MAIAFDTIPQNLRVPWTYVEITNETALTSSPLQPYRTLIVGQRLPGGTLSALQPSRVTGAAEARQLFGTGSQLAHMCERYFAHNTSTPTDVIAFDDLPAGVAASGQVSFAGTDVQAGTANLYVGGRRVRFSVGPSATAAATATACAAAINALDDLPVTASASAGDVELTCKWAGETGNRIDLRMNARAGETSPGNLIVTVTAMSGGAGNPDITAALPLLGDTHYNVIISPWVDTANLQALDDELEARNDSRIQKEGLAFVAEDATHAELTTLGTRFNSRFLSISGWHASPTPPYEIAAAIGGHAAFEGQNGPGRPYQTLELRGVLPPAAADRYDAEDRNLLLYDGISTIVAGPGDSAQIERQITTFRLNKFGEADPSYLDVPVLQVLSLQRYEIRTLPQRKYPRHKLGNDGRRYNDGEPIVTPSILRGDYIALAREWEDRALAENADAFAKSIIVERNARDANRLDVNLQPDVINQFMVLGVRMAFLL